MCSLSGQSFCKSKRCSARNRFESNEKSRLRLRRCLRSSKRLCRSLLLFLLLQRHLDALDDVIRLLVGDQLLGVGAGLVFLRIRVGRDLLVGVVEDSPDDLEPNLLRGASAWLGGRLGRLFLGRFFRLWWGVLVVVATATAFALLVAA